MFVILVSGEEMLSSEKEGERAKRWRKKVNAQNVGEGR